MTRTCVFCGHAWRNHHAQMTRVRRDKHGRFKDAGGYDLQFRLTKAELSELKPGKVSWTCRSLESCRRRRWVNRRAKREDN